MRITNTDLREYWVQCSGSEVFFRQYFLGGIVFDYLIEKSRFRIREKQQTHFRDSNCRILLVWR